MNRIIQVLLYVILFIVQLSAQDELEVKTSGNYYYGEAYSDSSDIDKMKKEAKEDLISKISSHVTLSSDLSQAENSGGYAGNYETRTRTISRLQLLGVNYIGPIKRTNGFRLIAYISKQSFKKSLNNLLNEIRQIVKIAEKNERERGLTKAATDYYLAYLKCSYSPEPIDYTSNLSQSNIKDLRPFLKDKLKKYLSNIRMQSFLPIKEPQTQTQVFIPVQATYEKLPVSNVSIQTDEDNISEYLLVNGSTKLLLNQLPMQSTETLPLRICMKTNPAELTEEIRELTEVNMICEELTIEIDYTEMIEIDFNFFQEGAKFEFLPKTENLSVTDFQWDFGDGSTSHEPNPVHKYTEYGFYDVVLQMNHQENLKVSNSVEYRVTEPVPVPPAPKNTNAENEILDKLIAEKSFKNLIKKLQTFKSRGKLVFGKKNDFPNPVKCYVFIVNPQSKEVIGVLTPGSVQRSNLLNHEIVSDISSTYKKMVSIWVNFYN